MRFFSVLDAQHVILAFFLGVAAAIIIYLSFWYGTDKQPVDEIDPILHHPDKTENKHFPPVLIFLYVGIIVWVALYLFFFFAVFNAKPY